MQETTYIPFESRLPSEITYSTMDNTNSNGNGIGDNNGNNGNGHSYGTDGNQGNGKGNLGTLPVGDGTAFMALLIIVFIIIKIFKK